MVRAPTPDTARTRPGHAAYAPQYETLTGPAILTFEEQAELLLAALNDRPDGPIKRDSFGISFSFEWRRMKLRCTIGELKKVRITESRKHWRTLLEYQIPDETEEPIFPAYRDSQTQVCKTTGTEWTTATIWCPRCRRRHLHGISVDSNEPEHRSAHCVPMFSRNFRSFDPPYQGYYILNAGIGEAKKP